MNTAIGSQTPSSGAVTVFMTSATTIIIVAFAITVTIDFKAIRVHRHHQNHYSSPLRHSHCRSRVDGKHVTSNRWLLSDLSKCGTNYVESVAHHHPSPNHPHQSSASTVVLLVPAPVPGTCPGVPSFLHRVGKVLTPCRKQHGLGSMRTARITRKIRSRRMP